MLLVPATWAELPLPQTHKDALDLAVAFLTLFLRLATTSAIGEEVADFTHKAGWSKFDKLLGYGGLTLNAIEQLRLLAADLIVGGFPFLCSSS